MNLNQLKSFHAVATSGSFTGAAKRLGVSQPALTSQVKGLESTYGVQLFHRRARGVDLTSVGLALFAEAERLFTVERTAEALLTGTGVQMRGSLRVGADNPYHLMPLLVAFRAAYPHVRIEASFGNSRDVAQMLRELRIDVAMAADDLADEQFEMTTFVEEPLVLVVGTAHPWASRKSTKLSILQGQELIRREAGSRTRAALDQACAEQAVEPRYMIEVEGREALREAIAAGLGAGVISQGELGPDERLVPISFRNVQVKLRQCVGYVRSRRDAPLIRAFVAIATAAGERRGKAQSTSRKSPVNQAAS